MSEITSMRIERLSLCLCLKYIRYKDNHQHRIFIIARFTRHIIRQEKELHKTDSQKTAKIIFYELFYASKREREARLRGQFIFCLQAAHLNSPSPLPCWEPAGDKAQLQQSTSPSCLHGTNSSRYHRDPQRTIPKVREKAHLSTSYEELGQQIKGKRSH